VQQSCLISSGPIVNWVVRLVLLPNFLPESECESKGETARGQFNIFGAIEEIPR
jgi:hypothetical protein